ncbi:MAG: hypothetical protein HC868_02180 [Sphingomonadales bacterium]|nr:hypothetical protein [Sphingomonadales bacterium]
MCHTMIIGAATVVIALMVIAGVACISNEPPDDIHAASALIDVTQFTGNEKNNPEK